ncbi:MAG: HAMP domain-containing sensor histidine kinase, partial [Anaerolineales bacterium]
LRELVEPEYHEQLDTIIRSATRLKTIIENLSSVDNFQSGLASLRSRMVSIKRLVEDMVDTFQPEADSRGITLRAHLGPADLWVDGDTEKLGLALGNLIKNALQFTEPGGFISVSAENVPGYVKISVVDTGIGIPSEDLTRIFERFYQVQSHLTRTHGGMGLGLSVTKAMVELHGGRVWAESMEGKGSTFTILLPLDAAQNTAAQRVFTP